MANNRSARKRIDIAKRNRLINKFYKSSTKTLIKNYVLQIKKYKNSNDLLDKTKAQNILNHIYSLFDKGVKKKVYHRNAAARKKSRLAALLINHAS